MVDKYIMTYRRLIDFAINDNIIAENHIDLLIIDPLSLPKDSITASGAQLETAFNLLNEKFTPDDRARFLKEVTEYLQKVKNILSENRFRREKIGVYLSKKNGSMNIRRGIEYQALCNAWEQIIFLSSVSLIKFKETIPIANTSGCLINYQGSRFLISMAPPSISKGEWQLEEYAGIVDKGQCMVGYLTLKMKPILKFRLISNKMDFTYGKLPDNHTSSCFTIGVKSNGGSIYRERMVYSPDFDGKPSKDKKYGFYSNAKFSYYTDENETFIKFNHRLEHDLKYIKSRGPYHPPLNGSFIYCEYFSKELIGRPAFSFLFS